MPLVCDSTGKKFGKTEGNALWLNKDKTSSYELYQYLINLEDSMIISYLKQLTFLSKEEIEEIEKEHKIHPELRKAQKILAREIITDLHGKEEFEKAVKISECLFNNDIKELTKNEIEEGFKGFPVNEIKTDSLLQLIIDIGAAASKREAREFISSGAVTINGEKKTDIDAKIDDTMFIENTYLILKRGKKNYYLCKK